MSSVLQQLQDDSAVLLMYLADELPPEDRAAVDQRLASEPALAIQLHEMQALQEHALGVLASADAVEGEVPAAKTGAASRAVGRAIGAWQHRQAGRPVMQIHRGAGRKTRLTWKWLAPMGAVAAAAAVLLTWALLHHGEPVRPGSDGIGLPSIRVGTDDIASAKVEEDLLKVNTVEEGRPVAKSHLREAEEQLAALDDSSQDPAANLFPAGWNGK